MPRSPKCHKPQSPRSATNMTWPTREIATARRISPPVRVRAIGRDAARAIVYSTNRAAPQKINKKGQYWANNLQTETSGLKLVIRNRTPNNRSISGTTREPRRAGAGFDVAIPFSKMFLSVTVGRQHVSYGTHQSVDNEQYGRGLVKPVAAELIDGKQAAQRDQHQRAGDGSRGASSTPTKITRHSASLLGFQAPRTRCPRARSILPLRTSRQPGEEGIKAGCDQQDGPEPHDPFPGKVTKRIEQKNDAERDQQDWPDWYSARFLRASQQSGKLVHGFAEQPPFRRVIGFEGHVKKPAGDQHAHNRLQLSGGIGIGNANQQAQNHDMKNALRILAVINGANTRNQAENERRGRGWSTHGRDRQRRRRGPGGGSLLGQTRTTVDHALPFLPALVA